MSLFDWLVCARTGASQPVAQIVRGPVADEVGRADCSVAGLERRVPPRGKARARVGARAESIWAALRRRVMSSHS